MEKIRHTTFGYRICEAPSRADDREIADHVTAYLPLQFQITGGDGRRRQTLPAVDTIYIVVPFDGDDEGAVLAVTLDEMVDRWIDAYMWPGRAASHCRGRVEAETAPNLLRLRRKLLQIADRLRDTALRSVSNFD